MLEKEQKRKDENKYSGGIRRLNSVCCVPDLRLVSKENHQLFHAVLHIFNDICFIAIGFGRKGTKEKRWK